MRIISLCLLTVSILTSCVNSNEPCEISLFNGKDLRGWHLYGGAEGALIWDVKDGILYCDPSKEGEYGDLVSDASYNNYEFSCEWKIDSAGNSGIFFNVIEREEYPTAWATGVEYQLLDNEGVSDHNFGDSSRQAGALYAFQGIQNQAAPAPIGSWNRTTVRMENGVLTYTLNGVQSAQMDLNSNQWKEQVAQSRFNEFRDFGKAEGGKIGLQAWNGKVYFKNLTLTSLDMDCH
jgi:hypothetical protein